jgi:hypothetical protein
VLSWFEIIKPFHDRHLFMIDTFSSSSFEDDLQLINARGCLTLEAMCFCEQLSPDQQEAIDRHLCSCISCAQERVFLVMAQDKVRRARPRFAVPTEVNLLARQVVMRSLAHQRRRPTTRRLQPQLRTSPMYRHRVFRQGLVVLLVLTIILLVLALLILLTSCRRQVKAMPLGLEVGALVPEQAFAATITVAAEGPQQRLAVATAQGKILVVQGARSIKTLDAGALHGAAITALSFSPDGQNLISAGGKALAAWDLTSGQLIRQVRGPQFITTATMDSSGKTVYFGTQEGHVLQWAPRQASATPVMGFACAGSLVGRFELSLPQNKRCPFGTYLEPESGPPVCTYAVNHLLFWQGTLIRSCREGTVGLLQTSSGQRDYYLAGFLSTLTVLPEGRLLFGRAEGEVRIYDRAQKKIIQELLPLAPVRAAASSADLIAVAQGRVIRLWDDSGRHALATVAAPAKVLWVSLPASPPTLRLLTEDGQLMKAALRLKR